MLRSLLATIVLAGVCFAGPAQERAEVTFSNRNRLLFDVDGNQVDAYAAKINLFEGKYYLHGLSFASGREAGVKAYSSVDLINWKYEGLVSASAGGRPHIIYDAKSKTYILWSNVGNGYLVSTSPSPLGPFKDVGSAGLDPQYAALQAADAAVATFGTQGYLIYSALNFMDPRAGSLWPPIYQTMHVSPLTSDYRNTTRVSYNVTSAAFDDVDQQVESPDMFVRDGTFYITASNTCGFCSGSIGVVYRSRSVQGPWKRDIVSAYSCGGQVEGVLSLTDPSTNKTTYVWHSTTTPGGPRVSFSGHIFQPLKFNPDGSVQDLDCSANAKWKVGMTKGVGSPATGKATSATDGTPLVADYQPTCDSDLFFALYQTWRNSKTGTLKEIAVNIAAGNNTNALAVKVFKFSTLSDLVSPGYKYTLLASKTFPSSTLAQSFNALSVPVDAKVAEGDMLGFSISEDTGIGFSTGNLIPYCHLEYETSSKGMDDGTVLLEQGSGQNSPRGLDGRTSPVQVRKGKAVKFFSTVV